jgi:hypothetical protein
LIGQELLPLVNDILYAVVLYFSCLIIFPLITIILVRKLIQEKEKTGKLNKVRLIIISIFGALYWAFFWEFIAFETPLVPKEFIGFQVDDFSLYNFGLGLTVSLGVTLGAYIYRLKPFYFTSLFIFFGLFFLYLYAGTSLILMPFVYVCGTIALIFLFYTGISLKDNGALGLAIFFLLNFIALFIPEEGILELINHSLNIFVFSYALYFALGFFTPYKETGGY